MACATISSPSWRAHATGASVAIESSLLAQNTIKFGLTLGEALFVKASVKMDVLVCLFQYFTLMAFLFQELSHFQNIRTNSN